MQERLRQQRQMRRILILVSTYYQLKKVYAEFGKLRALKLWQEMLNRKAK